jgi:hypothetical protein
MVGPPYQFDSQDKAFAAAPSVVKDGRALGHCGLTPRSLDSPIPSCVQLRRHMFCP